MNKWNKIISYQRTGRSHADKLKDTQDSIRVNQTQAYIVMAVADGVGSLPNSKYAADAATSAVCAWMKDNYQRLEAATADHLLRNEMIPWIRNVIRSGVAKSFMDISSMDCNLAFTCIYQNGRQAVCGSLGDCAVFVFGGDDKVLSAGAGLANASYTLLGPEASARLRTEFLDLDKNGVQGFLLTTDGLEDRIYWKDSAHPLKAAEDYFNASSAQELEQLVCQLPPRFDDDISIGILSRTQAPYILQDNPQWLCTCGYRNDITYNVCRKCQASFRAIYSGEVVPGDVIEFFRLLNKDRAMEDRILHRKPRPDAASKKPAADTETAPVKNAAKPKMQYTSRNSEPEEKEQPALSGGTPLSDIELYGISSRKEEAPADTGPAAEAEEKDTRSKAPVPGSEPPARSRGGSRILNIAAAAVLIVLLIGNVLLLRYVQSLETRIAQLEALADVSSESGPAGTEPGIPEVFGEEDEVYVVAVPVAYIWEEPNIGSKELVSQGTYVVLTGESQLVDDSTWVAVRSELGHEGWCRTSQLERVTN